MDALSLGIARGAVVLVAIAWIGGCAAPAAVSATEQPALAKIVEPYAGDLRKVGINSVMVYPNKARIRVTTRMGEVYFRYPAGLVATDFAIYVGASDLEVDSDGFSPANSAQYEAVIKAILPEAVQRANANNIQERQQRMSGGGG